MPGPVVVERVAVDGRNEAVAGSSDEAALVADKCCRALSGAALASWG
jgi:hypothetical protein